MRREGDKGAGSEFLRHLKAKLSWVSAVKIQNWRLVVALCVVLLVTEILYVGVDTRVLVGVGKTRVPHGVPPLRDRIRIEDIEIDF